MLLKFLLTFVLIAMARAKWAVKRPSPCTFFLLFWARDGLGSCVLQGRKASESQVASNLYSASVSRLTTRTLACVSHSSLPHACTILLFYCSTVLLFYYSLQLLTSPRYLLDWYTVLQSTNPVLRLQEEGKRKGQRRILVLRFFKKGFLHVISCFRLTHKLIPSSFFYPSRVANRFACHTRYFYSTVEYLEYDEPRGTILDTSAVVYRSWRRGGRFSHKRSSSEFFFLLSSFFLESSCHETRSHWFQMKMK